MYHELYQSITVQFAFMGLVLFPVQTAIISLNRINQLISVMMKCSVLFEVWTGFLNIIYMSFGFKLLISLLSSRLLLRLPSSLFLTGLILKFGMHFSSLLCMLCTPPISHFDYPGEE
jgi:hypothetical protein